MRNVNEVFGQRLRRLLDDSDDKQVDLAKLLNVTEASISRYLKGRIPDDPNALLVLANHFGVTVDYLLGRTDDPKGQADPSVAREIPDSYDPTDPKTRLIAFLRGSEITPEDEETIRGYLKMRKAQREAQETKKGQP